jgi:septum formation protein
VVDAAETPLATTSSTAARGDAPRLVLASASPRRADLLARLGLAPVVRAADIDETPHPEEPAGDLVIRLAAAKAAASAAAGDGTRDEVVLAADTEVVVDGDVLGKPRDRDDAETMLRRLAGRTHEVMTGIAVQRGATSRLAQVTTEVTFRGLTDAEVAWYLATGEPDGKAGAYALQGAGAALVERIDGSDTNVIGLPLAETVALLRQVGFDVLRPPLDAVPGDDPGR